MNGPDVTQDVAGEASIGSNRDSALTTVVQIAMAVGCAALLMFSASGVLSAARDGVKAVHSDPTDLTHTMASRFECVRHQIEDRVPAGSTVYIGDQKESGDPDQWHQRLIEMTFRHAIVTDDRAAAQFVLMIQPATPDDSCIGVRLDVKAN